jgi:hypothetical protein
VRRWPAIFLLIGFCALGTGLLEYLHLRVHQHESAQHLAHVHDDHDAAPGEDPADQPADEHCELCLHLRAATASAGWVPVLVCLGLFVAFLTLLSPRIAPQRVALRIDCRGPPVR